MIRHTMKRPQAEIVLKSMLRTSDEADAVFAPRLGTVSGRLEKRVLKAKLRTSDEADAEFAFVQRLEVVSGRPLV